MEDFSGMTTREEILKYGMTFPEVYQDTPFHDPNWILVRYKKKKSFSLDVRVPGADADQCQGGSRMERFLEKYLQFRDSRISSE